MAMLWNRLESPFFVLAPMDDVTDSLFRRIVIAAARPDVFFTEFVNVEGLLSSGRDRLLPKLSFAKDEHPIVAQIWGKSPDAFREVAHELVGMGFDGVDINFGCPDRTVMKNGGGAAVIGNEQDARAIVLAVKEGVKGKIPVSVKTRTGIREPVTDRWIPFLLNLGIDALTLHARTAQEQSLVPADWRHVAQAVRFRDAAGVGTRIIGNGDVTDTTAGKERVRATGCDGIMIGRGIFTNLHAFDRKGHVTTKEERIRMMRMHLAGFLDEKYPKKRFPALKKFFKAYIRDFDGASELRAAAMACESVPEVREVLNSWESGGRPSL